jgi:hypothetical protein
MPSRPNDVYISNGGVAVITAIAADVEKRSGIRPTKVQVIDLLLARGLRGTAWQGQVEPRGISDAVLGV